MERQELNTWIDNGCDFDQGRSLFNHYSSNDTLKRLFSNGSSYYNRKKLREELEALVSNSNTDEEKVMPRGFTAYRKPKKKIDPDLFPDSLKSEYYNLAPVWNEMRFLHSRLDLLTTDQDRYKHASRILELGQERRIAFQKIDYFLEHGKVLNAIEEKERSAPAPLPVDLNPEVRAYKLKETLQRLRVQRSKLKNKPLRVDDYTKVLEEITVIERELANV